MKRLKFCEFNLFEEEKNRMSKKKSIIVMIAFALIAVALTACGGGIDADASG